MDSLTMPGATLREEFGDVWQISERPAGLPIWTALYKPPDGSHERYIVAPGPRELLDRLRHVDPEEHRERH
jgi:hypothetical protein